MGVPQSQGGWQRVSPGGPGGHSGLGSRGLGRQEGGLGQAGVPSPLSSAFSGGRTEWKGRVRLGLDLTGYRKDTQPPVP